VKIVSRRYHCRCWFTLAPYLISDLSLTLCPLQGPGGQYYLVVFIRCFCLQFLFFWICNNGNFLNWNSSFYSEDSVYTFYNYKMLLLIFLVQVCLPQNNKNSSLKKSMDSFLSVQLIIRINNIVISLSLLFPFRAHFCKP
jgi:hypothetical protein